MGCNISRQVLPSQQYRKWVSMILPQRCCTGLMDTNLHRLQSYCIAQLSCSTAIMQLSAGKGFTGGVLELHSLLSVILVNQSIMTCQWQGGLVKHGVYMPHTYPMATGTATVPLK
jgi:hypothetical protein